MTRAPEAPDHGARLTRAVALCEVCQERPRSLMYGRMCFACYRAASGLGAAPVHPRVVRATVDHIEVKRPEDGPSVPPVKRKRCAWPGCVKMSRIVRMIMSLSS